MQDEVRADGGSAEEYEVNVAEWEAALADLIGDEEKYSEVFQRDPDFSVMVNHGGDWYYAGRAWKTKGTWKTPGEEEVDIRIDPLVKLTFTDRIALFPINYKEE